MYQYVHPSTDDQITHRRLVFFSFALDNIKGGFARFPKEAKYRVQKTFFKVGKEVNYIRKDDRSRITFLSLLPTERAILSC